MITMTAVRPPARFGELELNEKGMVKSFKEKPQMHKGWINGGFFVVEPKFIELDSDETLLEREPLEKAAEINELMAFKHEGFGNVWTQCGIKSYWKNYGIKGTLLGNKFLWKEKKKV